MDARHCQAEQIPAVLLNPDIGRLVIAEIEPADVLTAVRKIEAKVAPTNRQAPLARCAHQRRETRACAVAQGVWLSRFRIDLYHHAYRFCTQAAFLEQALFDRHR